MMENNQYFTLTLFSLFLTMLITTTATNPTRPFNIPPSAPPILPSSSASPPPSPEPQLNNIIDALIGAGDFSSWVSILSTTNPTVLPVSATLFIPQDNTLDHPPVDPFLFPYHVVPQRLAFSDLLLFPLDSRLPTLLPGKSISVTDNSSANFSLDGVQLTHPDLYSTASVAVHGVDAVLDYSRFGDGLPPSTSPPFIPVGDSIGGGWSGGVASSDGACAQVKMTFLLFFLVFVMEELLYGNVPNPVTFFCEFFKILFFCLGKALFTFVAYSMFKWR